jgi:hypothetical protein
MDVDKNFLWEIARKIKRADDDFNRMKENMDYLKSQYNILVDILKTEPAPLDARKYHSAKEESKEYMPGSTMP